MLSLRCRLFGGGRGADDADVVKDVFKGIVNDAMNACHSSKFSEISDNRAANGWTGGMNSATREE